MPNVRIANLETAASITGNEFLVLDDASVTRKTTVRSLSTFYFEKLNEIKNAVIALSSYWSTSLNINNVTGDYKITPLDSAGMVAYSGTQNITAFITNDIDLTGLNTTIAQLSSGTVTVALSSGYSGSLISYGDLYTTAGKGAVASVIRTSNDTFLISGLLQ
jgi:hypothetical protein